MGNQKGLKLRSQKTYNHIWGLEEIERTRCEYFDYKRVHWRVKKTLGPKRT